MNRLRHSSIIFCLLLTACCLLVSAALSPARAQRPDLGFTETTRADVARAAETRGALAPPGAEPTVGKAQVGVVAGDLQPLAVGLTNFGEAAARNVEVAFFLGDPAQGRRIGEGVVFDRIAPGQSVTAGQVWDTLGRAGFNLITVVIDPEDQIEEAEEANNVLSFPQQVFLPADFNQDGRVDLSDRDLLDAAIGKGKGDPSWNPLTDIWAPGGSLDDPPNVRPLRDGRTDDADRDAFDQWMDLNLHARSVTTDADHADHVVFDLPEGPSPKMLHRGVREKHLRKGEALAANASPLRPFVVGDSIRISVRFPTVGVAEVGLLTVRFYDGDPRQGRGGSGGAPDGGGQPIGLDRPILDATGGLGLARVVWYTDGTSPGVHEIFVLADPDDRKAETSETNNTLTILITLQRSTGVDEPDSSGLPQAFSLSQNAPNPFNAQTAIRFTIPTALSPLPLGEGSGVRARLVIFNAVGQPIRTLLDRPLSNGRWTVLWDGRDDDGRPVASGVYLYRLTADSGRWSQTRRMTLVR